MTVTLNLSPEAENALAAIATAEGLSVDGFLENVVRRMTASTPHPEKHQRSQVAPTMTILDGIPIFSAGQPMPMEMIQDTIDAVRAERIADSSRLP